MKLYGGTGVLVSRTPNDVAAQAADYFLHFAARELAERGRFTVALAGGSTPRLFHETLAARHGGIDWSKVHVFFSDERAVGPEHEHSNYHMAHDSLLARVPIPAENVHRVRADDGDHTRAATEYERELERILGPDKALDLVFLGMGEDGHTASLFPGAVHAPGFVVPAEAPPASPIARRVTFSYEALAKARAVIALITGAGKAQRLREVLAGGDLPMARVLRARGRDTIIITDEAAAARLGGKETAMDKANFGLIGLGVMGQNLALNIEEKGFSIAVFNRSTDKVDDFVRDAKGKRVIGTHSLKEFVAKLETPRRMVIMVKAGAAVDATIEGLLPYLSPGDVVIDGGNELFINTERRAQALAAKNIHFVGMGVSGGEEGARHGPSLMPGGSAEAYAKIRDVVTKIAAQVEDGPCVTHIGSGGSGHYVKMVHNGIEYGDMQLIAEAYDVLKNAGGLSNKELADVFGEWNRAELESFLIEITAKIFTRKDDLTGKDLVDVILDAAQMKGTGSWTVKEGADLATPIPTIASSVDARVMSAGHALRQKGAQVLRGPAPAVGGDKTEIIQDTRAALYAAKACSYAQGLGLLAKASATYKWDLDLGEIARIWKGGCIIRAAFLGRIQRAFGRDRGLENLLFDPEFREELGARQAGWRRTINRAVNAGIAVPTLTASLAYYDSLRRARMPMNLTQAQRDFFGAHTYQRIDREGTFHTEW